MEIVVKGRNSQISERFRELVAEKMQRIEKFDSRQKIQRVEVEVIHEKNPRRRDNAARIELTLRSRGPVIRAEAAAADQHSALDAGIDKLESRVRKMADRARDHRTGGRSPSSLGEVAAEQPPDEPESDEVPVRQAGPLEVIGDGPLVVREKTHSSAPKTLDQALYEMELVGHDFYLFIEKDSMQPSVVYRRCGYDYGVIHLNPEVEQ